MKMVYGVKDKPPVPKLLIFSFQQLLAIMTATLAVPIIVGNGMSLSAALVGAGVGSLVYLLFTKFKSPVFLGSSFAFIGSMASAFAGAASASLGYLGLIIGAFFAGLVYVVIAVVVKLVGVGWVNKLMPAVVIGPTVAIIGLSLAGNAVGDLQKVNSAAGSSYVALICGLVTLAVTMICANYGKRTVKMIPFIIGIISGYAFASLMFLIGKWTGCEALQIIDFSAFKGINVFSVPKFTFVKASGAFDELSWHYIATVAVSYVPVAFVVFAEHIADHKNLSSVIDIDLLEDPGLHRTLLGDGVGSMAGAFFGGCPNTTYGESVGCVAITKNASVWSILGADAMAILVAFIDPFVAFVNTIPSCVMGGVCMALYGFIAVSGLKMIQSVDLNKNRNLFVVSTILISGIGGLVVTFGKITLTSVACALILGILANLILSGKSTDDEE